MLWFVLFACVGESPSALACPGGGVWAMEISEAPLPTCADVQAPYDELLNASRFCEIDADCQLIDEHCDVGLGGCYSAVNLCLDQQFVDEVSVLWQEHSGDCPHNAGVCDCARPDATPICDDGQCVVPE